MRRVSGSILILFVLTIIPLALTVNTANAQMPLNMTLELLSDNLTHIEHQIQNPSYAPVDGLEEALVVTVLLQADRYEAARPFLAKRVGEKLHRGSAIALFTVGSSSMLTRDPQILGNFNSHIPRAISDIRDNAEGKRRTGGFWLPTGEVWGVLGTLQIARAYGLADEHEKNEWITLMAKEAIGRLPQFRDSDFPYAMFDAMPPDTETGERARHSFLIQRAFVSVSWDFLTPRIVLLENFNAFTMPSSEEVSIPPIRCMLGFPVGLVLEVDDSAGVLNVAIEAEQDPEGGWLLSSGDVGPWRLPQRDWQMEIDDAGYRVVPGDCRSFEIALHPIARN